MLASILLSTTNAWADARAEARRHFRNGMQLVKEGKVEEGAEELLTAYDLLPHPNVLYNVARAYGNDGNYLQALLYYEQYLKAKPTDEERVRPIVNRIRDRLRKQTYAAFVQEGAPPTAAPPPSEGEAPLIAPATAAPTPVAQQSITVTDEVLKVIQESAEQFSEIAAATKSDQLKDRADTLDELARTLSVPTAAPKQAPKTSTSKPIPGAQSDQDQLKVEGDVSEEDIYAERVVSASRIAESPLDAPNSITVVTAQDIRLTGLTNVADLLRRVAGIEVMTLTGGTTEVSIRGLNQRMSNKVLVLVNGRSVYLDFLGATLWSMLPVSVEEIERIEIIRGPASALYGADAFTGVINILLREPGKGSSHLVGSAGQGNSVRSAALFTGNNGRLSYRFGSGYAEADRYSLTVDPERVDIAPTDINPNRGHRSRWFNSELSLNLKKGYAIGAGTAAQSGEFSFLAPGRLRDLYAQDFVFAQSHINLSTPFGLTLRTFWNFFRTDIKNPISAPGSIPLDTKNIDSQVVDAEIEYNRGFDLIVPHALSFGAGFRYKSIEWTWLDDNHEENHYSLYIQDMMKIGDRFRFIASVRMDDNPLLSGPQFSPRGALVIRLDKTSAVRLGVGTAFRSPTFLESYLDNEIPTPVRGITAHGKGNTSLNPEEILSSEIGYTMQGDYLALETNLYYNQITNLISLNQSEFYGLENNPGFSDSVDAFPIAYLQYANETAEYRQLGGEFGIKAYPISGLDLYLNVSYHDTSPEEGTESLGLTAKDQRTSQYKLNLGVQYRSRFGIDAAIDGHWVSDQYWVEPVPSAESASGFERFELTNYLLLNARVGYRLFDENLELGLVGTNLLDRQSRQHPFGERLNRRILATAMLRF
uniref:Outer membrane receptor for ferrienterochelin and colicins n=1 Tax=uncultured myxobacterium HF0200_19H16 TaxID=723559 RepID=E7C3V3_9BACT|nr:outer membrane receptor for ferrienterochelin and colicins [uncultured myxobacterium HF0200_19H16]